LTGAPVFGDYDPNYSFNGRYISYSSFSPEGQAARLWVAAYTYDPPAGTFDEGTHPYHFDFEWSVPEAGSWSGQEGEFVISDDASIYDGYVLLRPGGVRAGADCAAIDAINPNQPNGSLLGGC
jgi:hypothetical protein